MLGFILFGLVVGALARLFKSGRQDMGILMTMAVGMVGSVIGGTIASAIGTGDIMELDFLGTVFAVISAVILIGIVESLNGRRTA